MPAGMHYSIEELYPAVLACKQNRSIVNPSIITLKIQNVLCTKQQVIANTTTREHMPTGYLAQLDPPMHLT